MLCGFKNFIFTEWKHVFFDIFKIDKIKEENKRLNSGKIFQDKIVYTNNLANLITSVTRLTR